MKPIFSVNQSMLNSRRIGAAASVRELSMVAELAPLLLLGIVAACLLAWVPLRISVPGHAILIISLPVTIGTALAPRRGSASIVSAAGGIAAALLMLGHWGRIQPAALAGLIALGPLVDLAMLGQLRGWRLYAGFTLAGLGANLLAFGVRCLLAGGGWDAPGSRNFLGFWPTALAGFVVCGAAAGLASAVICFRPPRVPESA